MIAHFTGSLLLSRQFYRIDNKSPVIKWAITVRVMFHLCGVAIHLTAFDFSRFFFSVFFFIFSILCESLLFLTHHFYGFRS